MPLGIWYFIFYPCHAWEFDENVSTLFIEKECGRPIGGGVETLFPRNKRCTKCVNPTEYGVLNSVVGWSMILRRRYQECGG